MEIYKNFSAVQKTPNNPDLSSNQMYLANTYSHASSNLKPEYYNDPNQQRKKKIKTIAVMGSALLLAGTAVGALFASNKNLGALLKKGEIQQMGEEIKQMPIFKKIGAFMANLNPVKDDAVERAAQKCKEKKIPILRHFEKYCEATKNLYRGILKKFQKGGYESAAAILEKEGVAVQKYDEWFDAASGAVTTALKGTKENPKFFTKGIFQGPKDFFSKMTKSNIANDVLVKNDAFMDVASEIVAPQGAKLSQEAQEALANLNKARGTITSKLRDINSGSAATDFMTIISSALGLGIATAASDTKEEKKSIAVNLGIPLLTTLSCNSFIGNAKAISGAPALLFSLACGQIASLGAKFIDKKVLGSNDNNQAV